MQQALVEDDEDGLEVGDGAETPNLEVRLVCTGLPGCSLAASVGPACLMVAASRHAWH